MPSFHEITIQKALEIYRNKVSILKKGYAQERFRLQQLANSTLGQLMVHEVTSVHIASYGDERLASLFLHWKLPCVRAKY